MHTFPYPSMASTVPSCSLHASLGLLPELRSPRQAGQASTGHCITLLASAQLLVINSEDHSAEALLPAHPMSGDSLSLPCFLCSHGPLS